MSKIECSCESCKGACRTKPGWFKPGEAEKTAELLEISLKELFDTKLGIDWWEDEPDIFLLSPAVVGMQPGKEYSGNPRGRCVFFTDDGLCEVHAAKPFECAELNCKTDDRDVTHARHEAVAKAWKDHQDQIVDLLGRQPEAEVYEGFFGGMF